MGRIGALPLARHGPSCCSPCRIQVDTSRYWFNYRHAANALAVYRLLRDMGVPDRQVCSGGDDRVRLFSLSGALRRSSSCLPTTPVATRGTRQRARFSLNHLSTSPCTPLSPHARSGDPYAVLSARARRSYSDGVEVDYRGLDVSVESFIRVLTGRHVEGTPPHKRLDSDAESSVLVGAAVRPLDGSADAHHAAAAATATTGLYDRSRGRQLPQVPRASVDAAVGELLAIAHAEPPSPTHTRRTTRS